MCVLVGLAAGGCAKHEATPRAVGGPSDIHTNAGTPAQAGATAPSGGAGARAGAGASAPSDAGDGDDAGTSVHCARQTAEAMLQPTYLFVAFDVSGSMGKGDKPWHDRSLKWEPVVAATSAFLEAPSSSGFAAALTFFPAAGGDDARCKPESYRTPDVPVTALPSPVFRAAMEAIGKSEWRGGTPTLYALQGVFDQVEQARKTKPGRYVVLLVTDGYPQDCDDDSIDSVAQLVKQHAAETPTYVIGVTNPPVEDAPDVTSNLTQVAEAGGTTRAYLIDTGDPQQTVKEFTSTVDMIRGATVSCQVTIPAAPAGRTFDKQKVSVRYGAGSNAVALTYDAACAREQSWRYDDAKSPREIVLCPKSCEALQLAPDPTLDVAFECEQVIIVPD